MSFFAAPEQPLTIVAGTGAPNRLARKLVDRGPARACDLFIRFAILHRREVSARARREALDKQAAGGALEQRYGIRPRVRLYRHRRGNGRLRARGAAVGGSAKPC